ncbi:MAG: hypothetical protein Tsb0021_07050 [Chlamydiales bacterium]
MSKKWCLLLIALVPTLSFSEYYPIPSESNQVQRFTSRLFDPQNMVAFSGRVAEVVQVPHPGGVMYGIHISVEDNDKLIQVHLGPAWFLEMIGLDLQQGEEVRIKGSLVNFNEDVQFVIASEIAVDDTIYTLRNNEGVPEWGGYRPKIR